LSPISKNGIVCQLGQPTSTIALLFFQESMHLGLSSVPYFKNQKQHGPFYIMHLHFFIATDIVDISKVRLAAN
jgi:hypothetical protein